MTSLNQQAQTKYEKNQQNQPKIDHLQTVDEDSADELLEKVRKSQKLWKENQQKKLLEESLQRQADEKTHQETNKKMSDFEVKLIIAKLQKNREK